MIHDARTTGRWAASLTIGVALTFGTPTTNAVDDSVAGPPQLAALVSEALANNPEIAAARSELDAARQRVAPAGALEDPMLEVGSQRPAPFAQSATRGDDDDDAGQGQLRRCRPSHRTRIKRAMEKASHH